MESEKKVCSFVLAGKLKELDVEQDSVWWWRIYRKTGETVLTDDDYCKSNPKDYEHISAFTFAEIAESLPTSFMIEKKSCQKKGDKGCFFYAIKYENVEFGCSTPANAGATLWIYLLNKEIENV